ncbi:MAG: ribosome small subunit-dependent GTPase A [Pseudomonadota bacterium]|nr:ribosome small subunit-dependent GTPase A [Pseudomonadota bacterium]
MTETGDSHRCSSRRRLDYVVCGDRVVWRRTAGGDCVVNAVRDRTNELARTDKRGRRRVVAANVDQLLVVTAHTPVPDWKLVDRYIASAENLGADCAVIYNKTDLGSGDADTDRKLALYADLGYPVVRCSARNELHTSTLENLLSGKTSIFVGQSGVGKSSLIKALHPHLDIRTGALGKSGRHGRHTTSRSVMYHTPEGGRLIDSPGVRSFDPPLRTLDQIETGFREISPCAGHCRFHNCTHTVEPGCAVLRAAEEGRIQADRLASYHECLAAMRESG